MRAIRDEPILTDTYGIAEDFLPSANSIYIYAQNTEQRSNHLARWRASTLNVLFYEIDRETQSEFHIVGNDQTFLLRSAASLAQLWKGLAPQTRIYIDITGLTHPVWAALLKSATYANLEVLAVYVEPGRYARSTAPVEGQIYDLSSRISGIAPLPGFAVLSQRVSGDFVFIPLLGFEGTRLRHLIEQVQPGYDRIYPVIGSPGFKPWYVFETYLGNKSALIETVAWQAVRYAPANCPFTCYYLLEEIAQLNPSSAMKIALVGTKPHALGAVIFALATRSKTELIYDHPIRKPGRTEGADRLHVYHVSSLLGPIINAPPVRLTRTSELPRQ
jgi:hypothetical protein